MFAIGVVTQFEAAHQTQGRLSPAAERQPERRTYRVEVEVAGPQLQDDGTLFDSERLHCLVDAAVADLHARRLDEVPFFANRHITPEEIARYLRDCLAPRLRGQGLRALLVRVWSSPQSYATSSWELI